MSERCHVKIITKETMANTVLGNETTKKNMRIPNLQLYQPSL